MAELVYLNPMMDYSNNGGSHRFITSCVGFEIKDGLVQDIRKIRFFNINNVTRGFITDNFNEGYRLCYHLKGSAEDKLIQSYPDIVGYLEKTPRIRELPIALSVNGFIEGNISPSRRHILDRLDLGLLKDSGINIFEYTKKKPVDGE
ncbi:MAG: hypothetical protein HOG34_14490 [Bacteroidetes bacterium]|jgi:hypothetical protein|nr:hypothetical protein [Bacteroidota bacterium]